MNDKDKSNKKDDSHAVSTVDKETLNLKISDAETYKAEWLPLLNRAYKTIFPNHINLEESSTNTVRSNIIYDSTAQIAISEATNQLQEFLMPAKREWASLEYLNDDELDVRSDNFFDKKHELDLAKKKLFKYYHKCNCDKVVNTALKKLLISTSAIYIEEGTEDYPLNFIDVSLRSISFNTYSNGDVKDVFYTKYLTAKEIEDEYGEHVLISSQYKATDKIKLVLCYTEEKTEDNKGYTELNILLCDNKKKSDNIIHTEYFGYSPWVISRWAIYDNERYGVGVIMDILSDIEICNKIEKFKRESVNTKYAGGYMRRIGNIVNDTDLLNNISKENDDIDDIEARFIRAKDAIANRIVDIKSNNSEPSVSSSDIIHPIAPSFFEIDKILNKQEHQANVNRALMFQPLGNIESSGQLTAYEVAQRLQLFLKNQGGTFARLETEIMRPIIERSIYILNVFHIKDHKERIDIAVNIRKTIHVSFKSQAQKIENTERLSNLLQMLQVIQSLPPQIAATTVNYDAVLKEIVELLDIDSNIFLNARQKAEVLQKATDLSQGQDETQVQNNNQ